MVHCGSRGFGHQVATDALVQMEKAMKRDNIEVWTHQWNSWNRTLNWGWLFKISKFLILRLQISAILIPIFRQAVIFLKLQSHLYLNLLNGISTKLWGRFLTWIETVKRSSLLLFSKKKLLRYSANFLPLTKRVCVEHLLQPFGK